MGQTAEIRPFREEDAGAAAALLRRLEPEELWTGELILHWRRTAPARIRDRVWVAADGGEIVGWVVARFKMSAADRTVAGAWVGVQPEARGGGLGSDLYNLAESHLTGHGARTIRSSLGEDPAGRRFAERRGYRETRREQFWTLDPRAADLSELPDLERARASDGFRVVRLGELLDRPEDLHALYEEAELDIPGDDERRVIPFEEWERETLANPLLDPDGSVVVVQGQRPVSFAWLLVDREHGRADHELTGTVRELRGLGLARLAKLAAVRWCAENGVRRLVTANDGDNAPMLAINGRLGYRPTIIRTEIAKRI